MFIVRTAIINHNEHEEVIVVGQGVDLLVLLTTLTPPDIDIFF